MRPPALWTASCRAPVVKGRLKKVRSITLRRSGHPPHDIFFEIVPQYRVLLCFLRRSSGRMSLWLGGRVSLYGPPPEVRTGLGVSFAISFLPSPLLIPAGYYLPCHPFYPRPWPLSLCYRTVSNLWPKCNPTYVPAGEVGIMTSWRREAEGAGAFSLFPFSPTPVPSLYGPTMNPG